MQSEFYTLQVTVTNCNEVTPLDELPKIPTLWEEDRKGEEGGEVGGKGGRRGGGGGEKEAEKEGRRRVTRRK